MRWLKSIITLLTISIIGGLVLLGYGFYQKTNDPTWQLGNLLDEKQVPYSDKMRATRLREVTPPTAFGKVSLSLPSGCSVTDIIPDRRRTYLIIGPIGHCHRIVVLNPQDGQILGTVMVGQ